MVFPGQARSAFPRNCVIAKSGMRLSRHVHQLLELRKPGAGELADRLLETLFAGFDDEDQCL